jgi:hypothetical protein
MLFYSWLFALQETIRKLANELFHEHQNSSDIELKNRLKKKLEDDEYCANKLQRMYDNDISFDMFWDDKLYSAVSTILNKLI